MLFKLNFFCDEWRWREGWFAFDNPAVGSLELGSICQVCNGIGDSAEMHKGPQDVSSPEIIYRISLGILVEMGEMGS